VLGFVITQEEYIKYAVQPQSCYRLATWIRFPGRSGTICASVLNGWKRMPSGKADSKIVLIGIF